MEQNKEAIEKELDPSGFSSVQAALGFCALGLLGILAMTPMFSLGSVEPGIVADAPDGIDRTVVGSVPEEGKTLRYTIRQSVMQRDPSIPCIIYEDGTQHGGC